MTMAPLAQMILQRMARPERRREEGTPRPVGGEAVYPGPSGPRCRRRRIEPATTGATIRCSATERVGAGAVSRTRRLERYVRVGREPDTVTIPLYTTIPRGYRSSGHEVRPTRAAGTSRPSAARAVQSGGAPPRPC